MGLEYKGIKQFEAYNENPFEVSGIRPFKRKPRSRDVMDTSTGEVTGTFTEEGKVEHKDSRVYVKLFKRPVEHFRELSVPAMRVFYYLIMNLDKDTDVVFIDFKKCAEVTNYKGGRKNIYKGLSELIEKNIIARKTGDGTDYFINPNVFFNGDRTKLWEGYQHGKYAFDVDERIKDAEDKLKAEERNKELEKKKQQKKKR